jgi:hypothetical protein
VTTHAPLVKTWHGGEQAAVQDAVKAVTALR